MQKNVENHAAFVERFLTDFYARGRFMKYSMSGIEYLYPTALLQTGIFALLKFVVPVLANMIIVTTNLIITLQPTWS